MSHRSLSDGSNSPTKPPRGQKVGRETGILMTVIKALLSSASASERDQIRATVEQDYKVLDKNLDSLIVNKQQSLNAVMQSFRHMCSEIQLAKERVAGVKSNLLKCKMLLHCRREELERLWLEGIEHKHALQILEQIDKIRVTPQQFTKAVARKQYSLASEILMGAISSWNEDLEQIEGLKELKADLKSKKEKLYHLLLEEFNTAVFIKSAPTIGELKRQGSGAFNPFQRSSSDRNSSGRTKMNQIKARNLYLDVTNNSSLNKNVPLTTTDSNPTVDELMNTITKCIVELKLTSKFKEELKLQLEEKLLQAINSISQQIIDFTDASTTPEGNGSTLTDFLKLTFAHFRLIVHYHRKVVGQLDVEDKGSHNHVTLSLKELWAQVQSVLQSTLKLYVDLGDTKGLSDSSFETDPNATDINAFFAKKKQPKSKKVPLFKFEYSVHGLSHLGEVENSKKSHTNGYLVCKSNPRNIIVIYNVVQELIVEIETQALDGEKCELRKFMAFNVNRVFVQQVYKEISNAIELSRKNPDGWKDVITIEEAKELKSSKPILQGVALIGRSVLEILKLATDLPSHSDQLLRILDPVLTAYRDSCFEVYSNLVRQEDKKVISASMVEDADIDRLLKSLPNWTNLRGGADGGASSPDESREDVRSQNLREADLFVGLFGGKSISSVDIMTDVKLMEELAHFHESMEWMARIVGSVQEIFGAQNTTSSSSEVKESIDKIQSLAGLFHELGSTCLLILYLEIRVHSFYYLSPIPTKSDFAPGLDSQVGDSEVTALGKYLMEIDAFLTTALQPSKTKYVFGGLGQLISTILIRGAGDIRRMNENGVKKMCRNIFHIQQTLCGISKSPEVSLDNARQFYELFLHPIQELFDSILEKGPQFREIEYMNAVQLLYRSKPGATKEPLNDYLTRLSNILGDVGVTV